MNISEMTIKELSNLLEDKNISSQELTKEYLQQIHQQEPNLNAFITVTEEFAIEAAKASDNRRELGATLGILDGIPFALKDNYSVEGIKMTCGSKMLKDYIPPYTATAADNLLKTGAILLGKNNMDEFAIGSSTENSAYGPVKNPLDPNLVPGGSSGGSAACVAAGEAAFSLGSDTGGSVRLPAACCGVVGLKPTYGLISRRGIAPVASSLDQAGIFARTAFDTGIILNYLASYDKYDSMSCPQAHPDYTKNLGKGVAGLSFGVPKEFLEGEDNPESKAWLEQAIDKLSSAGAKIKSISLPHISHSLSCYYILMSGEFSTNMGRFDGLRFGQRVEGHDYFSMIANSRTANLGTEVKTRILFGTYMLSVEQYEKYYVKAMKVRRLIQQDFELAFNDIDCIISPVQDCLPFKLGSRNGDSIKMASSDKYLIPANLAGLPAISIPYGSSKSLPGAIQLIGKQFSEDKLLNVADFMEGDH